MAAVKTVIHLIIAPNELPFDYEDQVCAAIDVYENGERTSESCRINYDDLNPAQQQQWDDFVAMINSLETP
jgi:hypothetical protein